MKRHWEIDELLEQWTLTPEERAFVLDTKTEVSSLGFALLLKWFQYEGRFPSHRLEVPNVVLAYLARQLDLPLARFSAYPWQGRTFQRHRAQIRQHLGFREATVQDRRPLTEWLVNNLLPQTHEAEALKAALYERCRQPRIEPPGPSRLERILHSARRLEEQRFCQAIHQKLPQAVCRRLDPLLDIAAIPAQEALPEAEGTGRSALHHLKSDAGAVGLDSILQSISHLEQLGSLPQ
jgi:hypothetical protein